MPDCPQRGVRVRGGAESALQKRLAPVQPEAQGAQTHAPAARPRSLLTSQHAQVVGLPMVGRELFERVVNHACAGGEDEERAANTSHLKPDKQRRRPRCEP